MRKAPVLELENAVVVIREPGGDLTLDREEALSSPRTREDTILLESFARMVWGPNAEEAADPQVGSGLDGYFIRETKRALKQNASAILILARPGGIHDADETQRALALFRGRICRTTLSPQAEAYLLAEAEIA
jgi:uncharacterized membrane protein